MSEAELARAIERTAAIDPIAYAAERLNALENAGDDLGARRFRAVLAMLTQRPSP